MFEIRVCKREPTVFGQECPQGLAPFSDLMFGSEQLQMENELITNAQLISFMQFLEKKILFF